MTRNFIITMIGALILAGIMACQTGQTPVVAETPSDHPHRLPYTKVIGDYHVSMGVDPGVVYGRNGGRDGPGVSLCYDGKNMPGR